jgi:hypothetical protein
MQIAPSRSDADDILSGSSLRHTPSERLGPYGQFDGNVAVPLLSDFGVDQSECPENQDEAGVQVAERWLPKECRLDMRLGRSLVAMLCVLLPS